VKKNICLGYIAKKLLKKKKLPLHNNHLYNHYYDKILILESLVINKLEKVKIKEIFSSF
jgi:hypothetical protein